MSTNLTNPRLPKTAESSNPTFPISTLQGLPQSATELPDIAGYQSTVVIMSARLVVIDCFSS